MQQHILGVLAGARLGPRASCGLGWPSCDPSLPKSLPCLAGWALGRAQGHLGYVCAECQLKPGTCSSPAFISRVPKAGLKWEVVFAAGGCRGRAWGWVRTCLCSCLHVHARMCVLMHLHVHLCTHSRVHACAYARLRHLSLLRRRGVNAAAARPAACLFAGGMLQGQEEGSGGGGCTDKGPPLSRGGDGIPRRAVPAPPPAPWHGAPVALARWPCHPGHSPHPATLDQRG